MVASPRLRQVTKLRVKNRSRQRRLDEALAAIISSTHAKNRPLPLTRIARWLDLAVSELGSYKAVSDRVGVSPKMLRQFSYVKNLAKPVKDLFERRQLDSVDAAAHLKLIPRHQQRFVGEALARGDLDTDDLRAVAQLRRIRADSPIGTIVEAVQNTKTKRHYVVEFVIRGSTSAKQIQRAFQKHISPKEVVSLAIDGPIGRLTLSRRGKEQLFKAARDLGVGLKDVVPKILRHRKS